MTRLLLLASYLPLDDSVGPPLAFSFASPSARMAVELSCFDGYISPQLSIRLCHQPYFRRPIVGLTKLHGLGCSPATSPGTGGPLFSTGARPPSSPPAPAGASPSPAQGTHLATDAREPQGTPAAWAATAAGASSESGAAATGAVAGLAAFTCGWAETTGAAYMTVSKREYPLQLPRATLPALYTRMVRVDGTKLPRTLHAAIWWLRDHSSVPLVLLSPFMRGRLSVYPPLSEDELTALSLPEFTDDKSQTLLLANNADLRARFAEFAGPALPFLLDVELPECRRAIDLTPLSGAVNMTCFSVSGDGLYGLDFLRPCERLEYVRVSGSPHLTDLSALTASPAKQRTLSALLAARTGIVDTAHFLSDRCTTLAYLDLSHCASLTEFASIGTLPSLRQLNLSHTGVSTLEWIGGCAQLEELLVVECAQLADLAPLASVKFLETLNASSSAVRHLEWLKDSCRFLFHLRLDNCKSVQDWSPISDAIASASLSWLSVAGCGTFNDLDWLRTPDNAQAAESFRHRLRVLNVSNCSQLRDASALRGVTGLTSLNLSATAVRDLSWLPSCTALEDLNLAKCPHVTNFLPVYAVTAHLLSLNLSWCTLANPSEELLANPPRDTDRRHSGKSTPSASLTSLTSLTMSPIVYRLADLDLSNCKKITSLAALAAVTGHTLRRVTIAASSVESLDWLTTCTALRVLHLQHCSRLAHDQPALDLSPLLHSAQTLQELNFSYTISVADITVLQACTELVRLNLANCSSLTDIAPLRALSRLELLNLAGCNRLTSLEPLRGCARLRQLNVSQCTGLTDFIPVGHLQELRRLDASATALDTVAWASRCRALEEVNVSRCAQLVDIQALGKLPNLARLNLAHSGVMTSRGWPLAPTVDDTSASRAAGVGDRDTRSTKRNKRHTSQPSTCHAM